MQASDQPISMSQRRELIAELEREALHMPDKLDANVALIHARVLNQIHAYGELIDKSLEDLLAGKTSEKAHAARADQYLRLLRASDRLKPMYRPAGAKHREVG